MSGILFSSKMGTVICNNYMTENHPKRFTRCHRLDWRVSKMKKKIKRFELPNSLYLLGKPQNKNVICSSWCEGFYQIFTWLLKCVLINLKGVWFYAPNMQLSQKKTKKKKDLSKIFLVSKFHTNRLNLSLK